MLKSQRTELKSRILLGVIAVMFVISGCQHSEPQKRYACDNVERNAKSSQGLMDWASNDGEGSVERSARAEFDDSSDEPGLKYDCAASAKGASTLQGRAE